MALKITKGEASIHSDGDFYVGGKYIAHVKSFDVTKEQYEANAELISEAFNVANETGLTPRELLERIKELERELNELEAHNNAQ